MKYLFDFDEREAFVLSDDFPLAFDTLVVLVEAQILLKMLTLFLYLVEHVQTKVSPKVPHTDNAVCCKAIGVADDCIVVDDFDDILDKIIDRVLLGRNYSGAADQLW